MCSLGAGRRIPTTKDSKGPQRLNVSQSGLLTNIPMQKPIMVTATPICEKNNAAFLSTVKQQLFQVVVSADASASIL